MGHLPQNHVIRFSQDILKMERVHNVVPLWLAHRALQGNSWEQGPSTFFCTMCELSLNFGFSPKLWEVTCTLMIEKSVAQGPRINKLRVIHLLKVDYNFDLKLVWGNRLLRRAQEN